MCKFGYGDQSSDGTYVSISIPMTIHFHIAGIIIGFGGGVAFLTSYN